MSAQKPRKALADSLATEFVYNAEAKSTEQDASLQGGYSQAVFEGEVSPSKLAPLQHAQQTKDINKKESSLMSKLNLPQKEATIRLSVDLPLSLNQKLSDLAHKTGRKKAEIVRLLLDEAFKND